MSRPLLSLCFGLLLICGATCGLAQPQPGTQLWAYEVPGVYGQITGSPALAPDGTIYLGAYGGLFALTNTGIAASNKWTFPVSSNATFACSPTIGPDGTIYFGDDFGDFYALNPNGTQRWAFPAEGVLNSSAAIGPDNTLYFVTGGQLTALTPTGQKKWQRLIDDSSFANPLSPVVGSDGTIYVGSRPSRTLYAFRADGTLKWQFGLASDTGESLAIGADGTIYITGAFLYAIAPTGSLLWKDPNDSFNGASPIVGKDGSIYVAEITSLSLYAFAPAGTVKWVAAYGQQLRVLPISPAVDASGMIYYCASNSVFAISRQGVVQWVFPSQFAQAYPPPPAVLASPAIGPDGTIYAAFFNTLYALQGSGSPLATTPWPMHRQNLRHTGKVEQPTLSTPRKRVDANFDLQLSGELGQAYTLQTTSNFLSWTSLTSFVATSLSMPIPDLAATNSTARFYRATTP